MELQVGVKILLKNKDGKYLLLHRSNKKYPDVKGTWDIAGGRINPGTPLIENLKREILEETQLKLTSEPKLIYAQDILRVPGRHVVRLTYIGEIDGEPTLDEDHSDFKLLTVNEMKAMDDLDVYLKEVLIKFLDKNFL